MKGIDKLLRARIEEWLAKESHTADELTKGATMMLQCTRNVAMFNTVMRKPSRYEDKIAYELRKHLTYLNDDLNLDEVKDMEKAVLPAIGKTIEKMEAAAAENSDVPADSILPVPNGGTRTGVATIRGKRADHDSLPQNIQDLWTKNAERYKKIKQAHETCKTLTAACDRYEYTKAIAELWAVYKKDFETYDNFVDGAGDATTATTTGEAQLSAEDVKAIKAARPYISKNLQKLLDLVAAAKTEGFTDSQREELESWRSKIQERVDVLLRTGQAISDEVRSQLAAADITLETVDSDE